MPTTTQVRMTSFAPQFLVDDLNRSIAYYQKIGSALGSRGRVSTQSAIWTDLKFT